MEVINTAVLPLVGGVSSSKLEVGRVIDSSQGEAFQCSRCFPNKLEGASWLLRQDGAADGVLGANENLKSLLHGVGYPVSVGGQGDVWLNQKIWRQMNERILSHVFMFK